MKLSSDPEHKLLVKDAGDIWVTRIQDQYMNQVYDMVQPAVVVIDTATGKTIKECTWSWKTMGFDEENLTEMWEAVPGVPLVTYRPVIADLRAAIKERRPPKIADNRGLVAGLHEKDKS
uniref:Uncharacterized protein n=1 Tax=Lotharella globosa TaxID=91324 RepID=A0A6U2X2Q0_9EUKA|mmetsp:Transcript_1163/g.2223  ORF Transcript_1163/g.2223 Transcript_1163/m.2223 type:complete len:119 (-) Transcript_1163:242-598(-)